MKSHQHSKQQWWGPPFWLSSTPPQSVMALNNHLFVDIALMLRVGWAQLRGSGGWAWGVSWGCIQRGAQLWLEHAGWPLSPPSKTWQTDHPGPGRIRPATCFCSTAGYEEFLHFLNGWRKSKGKCVVICEKYWNSNFSVHNTLLEPGHAHCLHTVYSCFRSATVEQSTCHSWLPHQNSLCFFLIFTEIYILKINAWNKNNFNCVTVKATFLCYCSAAEYLFPNQIISILLLPHQLQHGHWTCNWRLAILLLQRQMKGAWAAQSVRRLSHDSGVLG